MNRANNLEMENEIQIDQKDDLSGVDAARDRHQDRINNSTVNRDIQSGVSQSSNRLTVSYA